MPSSEDETDFPWKQSEVATVRRQTNKEDITNMDEVPFTFNIPVNHTVEKRGTSTVSIRTTGHDRLTFTVVLGCHGNGQKLPPMVIFKRKTLAKEKFPRKYFYQT